MGSLCTLKKSNPATLHRFEVKSPSGENKILPFCSFTYIIYLFTIAAGFLHKFKLINIVNYDCYRWEYNGRRKFFLMNFLSI